jgi:transketolase N-terminal domain/subunit
MATEPEDGKDPKRACVVLSKGHEVVRLGYSRLTGAAAKVTDREENSGTPTGLAKIEAQINEKNKLARITGLAGWATWSR